MVCKSKKAYWLSKEFWWYITSILFIDSEPYFQRFASLYFSPHNIYDVFPEITSTGLHPLSVYRKECPITTKIFFHHLQASSRSLSQNPFSNIIILDGQWSCVFYHKIFKFRKSTFSNEDQEHLLNLFISMRRYT